MGLEEDYAVLAAEHKALNKRGKKLEPLVLAHFNSFVRNTINPALPEGITLIESNHASHYPDGKFIVSTGCYQTPEGPTKGPLECERTVMDLLRKYKEETPWIDRIWDGFSLSR